MNEFIAKYQDQISGVLSGYDRLLLNGNVCLNYEAGLKGYLWANGLGLKDFGDHAERISREVKQAALDRIAHAGRPVRYLNGGAIDKAELARTIAREEDIDRGLIAAFTAVELCRTYSIRKDGAAGKLRLEKSWRKCLMVYRYSLDPVFGFMATRLQTWFPFPITVYLNGREWLARQMTQARMRYRKHKNCFTWVEDFDEAQRLFDQQLAVPWDRVLTRVRRDVHPFFPRLCTGYDMHYYWTCPESEWAMDIIFRNGAHLRRLYPQLLQLAMTSFSSTDVLRFFGKRATREGASMGRYEVPISTDLKVRVAGARVKHRYGDNSLKIYDKAYDELGAVLRPEITINRPEIYRVFRTKNNDPEGEKAWRSMRRGTVDLGRRAQACQKALDVYCSALAEVDDSSTLAEILAALEKRVRHEGRSYRGLHPFEVHDLALLRAANRGEFAISGLRNRDLQALLYGKPPSNAAEQRRRSAAVGRQIKLLRVHGILRKLPHTHRYRVTDKGRKALNAILMATELTAKKILAAA